MANLQVAQSNPPADFIDLGLGSPGDGLLPLGALGAAAQRFFAAGDRRPLHYGLEQGDGYFRQALASFLTSAYGAPVDPNRLIVTSGASSALDLICTLFTQPGEAILVEEPSYHLALRIFRDHGLRIISLPMDEDGLRVEIVEEKITESYPKFIYVIPTFQNPSGRTLTQERRERLVELAQRHNVPIIADEVYHFLAYTRPAPRPFAFFTVEIEQVISVNSFSKILAPGLRLGWIQAHGNVIQRLAGSGLLDSGGGMNPFTSAIGRYLIEAGDLEENIQKLRKEYAGRLEAMGGALREHLPEAEWVRPEGGFFCWVRLPGVNAVELRQEAERFKVGFLPGVKFSSQNGMKDFFRLSFSFYPPEKIAEGVKRIRDCLESSNFHIKRA